MIVAKHEILKRNNTEQWTMLIFIVLHSLTGKGCMTDTKLTL